MKTALVRVTCVLTLGLFAAIAVGAEHTKDSLDTVKQRLKDKDAVLVDVREKSEWDEGHLKQAKLVPLSDLKQKVDPKKLTDDLKLKKGTIVYMHCAAGARCLSAAKLLEKHGFDARPLKPGYDQLLKAGFEKASEEK